MYGIIYLLTSPSGKHYVGQTVQLLEKRWCGHINGVKRKSCRYLSNAILKYGPENFEKDTVAECPDKSELDRLEQFWIALLKSNDPKYGYNIRSGGARGKHSEETKRQFSLIHKGRPLTEEHRRKISENSAVKGKPRSEEVKRKISEANLGANNGMFGVTLSEETRRKMSEARTGKNHTEEWCRNISEGLTGRKFSEITKEKLRLAWIRRKARGEQPWNKGRKSNA